MSRLVVGVLALGFGALVWTTLTRNQLEREAKQAALGPCVDGGLTAAECERRIDQNSAACFRFNYTSSGLKRPGPTHPEFLDVPGYRACAADVSAAEWNQRRVKLLQQGVVDDQEQRRLLGR